MILLFMNLQIYMLHIEILLIRILLLPQFSDRSLLSLFGNLACINQFLTVSISIISVKRESIQNKNSASQVYWGIFEYLYLVLGIFYYDFWNIFSRSTPSVCCRWLVNSYKNKKYLERNSWIVFLLRLVIAYPQVQLFVVGLVPFILRLSKYLFNSWDSF